MYKEEKKGEFIGRSDLSIPDLWLVDGLVASASHSLGPLPLPYPALAAVGAAKPLLQWSSNSRIHTNYLGA